MLLKQATLEAVADGKVTLAFRRWRRPTVRTGGSLTTSIGVLSIDSVDPAVYRVSFHVAGPDPRIALRTRVPESDEELDHLRSRLARWDAASTSGPWTLPVLKLIEQTPGVRAADLAAMAGQETKRFKGNVRKLKGLGLTESLEIGYRLSPRGEAVLEHLSQK
jgi:hypothetical protein